MKALFTSIVSGLLVSLAFPTVVEGVYFPNLGWLAWFALVPLFWICQGATWRQVLWYNFIHGLVYNAATSYWIFYAMHRYGGLPVVSSIAGVLAMASILGLMQGLFVALAYQLSHKARISLLVLLPFVWALYEWARTYGPFGGYPWSQLTYTQSEYLYLIQSCDLLGVYGLGALIVYANLVLSTLLKVGLKPRFMKMAVCSLLVLVLGVLAYGQLRLEQVTAKLALHKSLKIALIQPNVAQELKWDPARANEAVSRLKQLTQQAVDQQAELIIWPESAYPDALPGRLTKLEELTPISTPLLIGAVTVWPGTRGHVLKNSALYLEQGQIKARDYKTHLVPLGEYVPFRNVVSWMDKIVPAIGDFEAGTEHRLMQVAEVPYGVTICYEDLFPGISREITRSGARLLTNLTNDAWYADSSAQWQHLNFSRIRAIENRRSMVRSTNTGVTAVIHPDGRIAKQLVPFKAAALVAEVPLFGKLSIYTRYGDMLWILGFVLLLAITTFFRQKDAVEEEVT